MTNQQSLCGLLRDLRLTVIVAGLVILAPASSATAASIALPSTGIDNLGDILPEGSLDTDWAVVAGPGIGSPVTPVVVSDFNIANGGYAQSLVSQWIWVDEDGVGAIDDPYTFRLTFDLTGFDTGSTWLSGSWGTDNNGVIRLNGADAVGAGQLSLSGGGIENFQNFYGFLITGGFVAGVNTLDFVVEDDNNPGAFNAFNLMVSDGPLPAPVPEPSSLALASLGLAIGVHLLRRRTR